MDEAIDVTPDPEYKRILVDAMMVCEYPLVRYYLPSGSRGKEIVVSEDPYEGASFEVRDERTREEKKKHIEFLEFSDIDEDGFYWYRKDDQHRWSIMQVWRDDSGHWCCLNMMGDENSVENYPGDWDYIQKPTLDPLEYG